MNDDVIENIKANGSIEKDEKKYENNELIKILTREETAKFLESSSINRVTICKIRGTQKL